MDGTTNIFTLLSHELEATDAGVLLSPFDVVRMAEERLELRTKLVNTLLKNSNLSAFTESINDIYDDLISPVIASKDPLPIEALPLWQPLLVLVHEAFGCYEVIREYERYASDLDDAPKDILETIGIERDIAERLPCLHASYALKFYVQSNTVNTKIVGLVLHSDECRHVSKLKDEIKRLSRSIRM